MKYNFILFSTLLVLAFAACKSNKEATGNNPSKPENQMNFIEDEIIVQLVAGSDIKALLREFSDIDLELMRSLGADMYLVSYDTAKASPERILRTLNQSDLVTISEFNKEVSIREGGRP